MERRLGSRMNEHAQRYVVAFAAFVLCFILLSAYFTDRDGGSFGGDFDELVLQNPPYMLVNFGKLTFYEQPVISHPPIHVGFSCGGTPDVFTTRLP